MCRRHGCKQFGQAGRTGKTGGKRLIFPAKSGTHQGRWCYSSLKASVQDSVTGNLERTRAYKKILIVSGERRGESTGQSLIIRRRMSGKC